MVIKVLAAYSLVITLASVAAVGLAFDAREELAVTTESLLVQESMSLRYEAEVHRQANRYSALMRKRVELQDEVYTQKSKIERYLGRESVVYAKPGLVERLEKRAMDKFFKEIESDDD